MSDPLYLARSILKESLEPVVSLEARSRLEIELAERHLSLCRPSPAGAPGSKEPSRKSPQLLGR